MVPFLRPNARYAAPLAGVGGSGDAAAPAVTREGNDIPLVFFAICDVFTLLAAATRAADGVAAGSAGLLRQSSRARAPEDLSELIASLPGETLGVSRASESAKSGTSVEGDAMEGGGGGGRGEGSNGAGRGGGDAGLHPLLSDSSALVFVKEFLRWAGTQPGNPPELVAEGWDAGVGVWLGLTHCVRALVRALEAMDRDGGGSHRERRGGGGSRTTRSSGLSAEAIALAVFDLRSIVGTPSAALLVVDPSSSVAPHTSPATPHSSARVSLPAASAGDFAGVDNNEGNGTHVGRQHVASTCEVPPVSCWRRPPPGAMTKGFLKRMSGRWKAHLEWGLPGLAPPRRASPRIELNRRRRQSGGYGGHKNSTPEGLRAEADDLFFALRGELLRAERLALTSLLVGPSATSARRRWAMQAALASARRREGGAVGHGLAENGLADRPRSLPSSPLASPSRAEEPDFSDNASGSGARSTAAAAGCRTPRRLPVRPAAGQEPEAGSGPARLVSVNATRSCRKGGKAMPDDGKGRDGAATTALVASRRWEAEREEEGQSTGTGGLVGYRQGTLGEVVLREGTTRVVGAEEDDCDGLGRLCFLAAVEMREGLESGLSVKLTQVRACVLACVRVRVLVLVCVF